LQEGIGDTIRASLTPAPNGDRTEEVVVCQQILQALAIRSFTPQVAACRAAAARLDVFQELAEQIQAYLRQQMPVWKEHHWCGGAAVAVMGCIVNGRANRNTPIWISLPGTAEEPKALFT